MFSTLTLAAEGGLKIPWAEGPTYNTIMAIAAGVSLLLLVDLGRKFVLGRAFSSVGYALAFVATGSILTLTGLHMTLTWPLARIGFPYDNIIFGEPSLAFGVMLLVAALYLWRHDHSNVQANERAGETKHADGDSGIDVVLNSSLRLAAEPISWFAAAMGLALFGIAAAGWKFTLFAAPPEEPISGNFANHPLLEATFISGIYLLTGLGAVLLPFAVRTLNKRILWVIGASWIVSGLAFTLFGALNYYTHIGLIIHTS